MILLHFAKKFTPVSENTRKFNADSVLLKLVLLAFLKTQQRSRFSARLQHGVFYNPAVLRSANPLRIGSIQTELPSPYCR